MAPRSAALGGRWPVVRRTAFLVVNLIAARSWESISIKVADCEFTAFAFAQVLLVHVAVDWCARFGVNRTILRAWTGLSIQCDVINIGCMSGIKRRRDEEEKKRIASTTVSR